MHPQARSSLHVLTIKPLPGCARGLHLLGHVIVRASWEENLRMLAYIVAPKARVPDDALLVANATALASMNIPVDFKELVEPWRVERLLRMADAARARPGAKRETVLGQKSFLLEEGRVGDLNWTPYILAQVRGVAESPVECAFLDALADKQQPRHVAESGRRPSGAAS